MADTHLGEKVRSIRESRSMTTEQLAERADLAPELVAQIESGSLIPSLSPLIRIARVAGGPSRDLPGRRGARGAGDLARGGARNGAALFRP